MKPAETVLTDDAQAAVNHAIVIGASMAGLLAARVLADHYARVTVIERDTLPQQAAARAGVPQARHAHVLLMRGQQILERLFPGLQAELRAAGAPALNWSSDWALFQNGAWAPRFRSTYVACTASRDLLEATVRNRLRTLANVHFLEQYEVVDLVAADQRRVVGVRTRERGHAGAPLGEAYSVPAALVVDASGRESRAAQWLVALGYAPPEETTINAFLAYASRWYRRPDEPATHAPAILVGGRAPDQPRSGVLYPVEGERWLVTLGGIGGVYPPTDDAGFLDFARAMVVPAIYDVIKDAEPLTPAVGYRRTENRWRHYERLDRLPDGFVVVGDAVCAFNPVYGQGMTVGAMGAEALDQALRVQRPGTDQVGLPRRFQQQLARVVATPWLMATGEDLRWPATVGGSSSTTDRLLQRYIDRVLRLVAVDAHAYHTFMDVSHLLQPPAALFSPRIMTGVLRQALPGMRGPRVAPMTDVSSRSE